MRTSLWFSVVPALTLLALPVPAGAAGGAPHIEHQHWSFGGFSGRYEKAQLQRGFQVYQGICAGCHGLERVRFRNLTEPGGPEFPEEAVKALAAEWPNKITDGPDDAGKMFERAAGLPDPIRGPFKNEKEARATFNGAYPPDLSVIAKARNVEYHGSWYYHPVSMIKDIATGYQEGGTDYIHALLTHYKDAPPAYTRNAGGKLVPASEAVAKDKASGAERCVSVVAGEEGKPDTCNKLGEGMNYNTAFPGGQIAMSAPLADGVVPYKGVDGVAAAPATTDQYARDVAAFLTWTADPSLNARKTIGWQVMLYLLITTVLLFIGKKRIWAKVKH